MQQREQQLGHTTLAGNTLFYSFYSSFSKAKKLFFISAKSFSPSFIVEHLEEEMGVGASTLNMKSDTVTESTSFVILKLFALAEV